MAASPVAGIEGALGLLPGSPEAQMRTLADLAFLMQDYETALSTLRALAADLRADKAWRPYAAVQVTQGLKASLFLPNVARETARCKCPPSALHGL